jgi:hypothetical protein
MPQADKFETTLLGRNDPLIDLGLASFGISTKVAKRLFFDARPDHPCREVLPLAILSNGALSKVHFEGLPAALFKEGEYDSTPDKTAAWLRTANDAEIAALFSNPELDSNFLSDLMANHGVWASVPEAVRLSAIFAFARAEWPFNRVSGSVWSLAQNAPVTTPWAYRIALLYDRLPPHKAPPIHEIKEPVKVASRWFPDPNNAEAMRLEELDQSGYLQCYQTVRMHLACAALVRGQREFEWRPLSDQNIDRDGWQERIKNQWIGSNDIAFRCAAYRTLRSLTREGMLLAFEKDKKYAVRHLLQNETLWREQDTRDELYKLVQSNGEYDHFLRQEYWSAESKNRTERPDWFGVSELELIYGDDAASRNDIRRVTGLVSRRIDALQSKHTGLERKIGELRSLIILGLIVGLCIWITILLRKYF